VSCQECGTQSVAVADAAVAVAGMLDSGQVFGTNDHARAPPVPVNRKQEQKSQPCSSKIIPLLFNIQSQRKSHPHVPYRLSEQYAYDNILAVTQLR
jgi:hypothetical protein